MYTHFILNQPTCFHRDFENDLPTTRVENENYYMNIISRVATASLPFLALYKPVEKMLSITTSATREIGCSRSLVNDLQSGENIHKSLFDSVMCISSITGTIFMSPMGMVIATCHDLSLNAGKIYTAYSNNNHDELTKINIQLADNFFYLMTMVYGGIELQVASSIMMTLLSAYSSRKELEQGHYIESGSHMLMTLILINQLHPQLSELKQKYNIKQNIDKFYMKTTNCIKASALYVRNVGTTTFTWLKTNAFARMHLFKN